MERQKILESDYLDLLFDQRNKQYGGYELRKAYRSRAGRAVSGVLLFTFAVSAIPVIAGLSEKTVIHGTFDAPTVMTKLDNTIRYQPPKPVAPKPAATAAPAANTAVIPTVIKPTREVLDPPKELTPDVIAGPADGDGKSGALTAGTGDELSKGTDVVTTTGVELPGEAEPIAMPDEMPLFNGDVGSYLSSHLNYPEPAREAGKEGRVVLRFVVAEDGAITNIEVAKSVYPELDGEAIRVVRSMPRWKPGRVKGKAVKSYFALPITFRLD